MVVVFDAGVKKRKERKGLLVGIIGRICMDTGTEEGGRRRRHRSRVMIVGVIDDGAGVSGSLTGNRWC